MKALAALTYSGFFLCFLIASKISSFIEIIKHNSQRNYLKLFIFSLFVLALIPPANAARLPTVGGDVDLWGDVLNDYLLQQHNASGGHINVTTDNLNVTNTAILARDSGRVGIATSAPITTLDVRGNVNVTGFGNFSILQLVTGGTLLFPNNIITAAMVQILNGTKITDVVQSIAASSGQRIWGNVSFDNSSMINFTISSQSVTAAFNNISLANLDTRQRNDNTSVARTNTINTFTANQFITGNLNVSALTNITNLTANGLTLLNMNNLTGFNYTSNYALFAGNSINVSGLVNATQLLIYGTDVTLNLSRLNVSTTLLNDRLVSFNTSATAMNDRLVSFNTSATAMNDRMVLFNTSATNLDTRQKNDNASVARTNVGNTFTATQTITGGLNVTTFINATELWASSRINGSIDCKYLTGGSDVDFCADIGTTANASANGTTGYIAKFANATTLDNSVMFQNGTSIGISTTNPVTTFDVRGSINVTGLINITNLTANGLTLLNMNNLTGFNYTTNYALFAGNSINVSGLVNATQLLIYGTDVTANLSALNISATLLNDRLVSFNTSATAMNDRLVSFNTSATAMNDRLVSFNTSATAMNDRMVLFNTSATNLDTRQKNDNASIARTNVENTFTAGQIIQGRVNVTSFVNATDLYLRSALSCTGDLETNAAGQIACGTDQGGAGTNGTLFTNVVQSIAVSSGQRIWGNVSFDNSSTVNFTISSQSVTAAFNNISLSNLDTRQTADNASVARTNVGNTFTANQFITGNLNVSALANITNLTVNGLTLLNMNNLTGFNYTSNYALFAGNSINVSGLVNATQLLIYGTDVTLNLSRLNVSTTLLEGRVVTFNTSATNLDTRQANDNASVARTNVQNTFTASQIITGGLNVTTFINATEVWASSRINGSIDCKYLTGGSDGDFCADSTATVTNATTLTDVVQSIAASGANRAWGNVTIATGSFLTISQSAGLTNPTLTIAGVGNLVLANQSNTFTANQFITGNLNVSALANITNLTANGLTLLNMNNLTGFNYTTNYALFAGNSINVSGLVNATQLLIYGTDVTANLSRLNVSTTLLEGRVVTFNTSATNLDTRQKNDNASVARTNTPNTFTQNITIAESLDVAKYLNVSGGALYVNDANNNVGINTTTPTGTLQIDSRSVTALLVRDNTGANILVVNGSTKSVAMGGSTASGSLSFAAGSSTASGSTSVAMGSTNTASGITSVAMGSTNTASSTNSVAMGGGNTASNEYSVAVGLDNIASGATSVAMGNANNADGSSSVAMGDTTTANGTNSFAAGQFVRAMGNNSIVIGRGIQNTATGVLQNSISNSLMIGFNSTLPTFFVGTVGGANVTGVVGINTTSPSHTLTVVGTLNVTGGTLTALGLFVDASGNVGIGTGSPVTTLDVRGALNISGRANFTGVALKNLASCTEALETSAAGEIVCGTDVGGAGSNGTLFTDVVQSIIAAGANRAWGNATIATGSFLTISQSAGLTNPTLTIAGVSNLVLANQSNTFTANQFITGNLNVSALANITNLTANGLTLLNMNNLTGFNYTTNYALFAGNSINVSGLVNATQLLIYGTDVTANLSALNISTTLLNDRLVSFNTSATAMNDRLVSFNTSATAMNDRLVSFNTSATAMNDRLVSFNTSATLMNDRLVSFNTSATAMNDRLVSFNTSATAMNDRLVSFNTSATAMNDRMVLFNTSATNLDTRQKNDNASVARTNVGNTFTATQTITGGLNVTTFINATEVWASSRINGSVDCKYLTGGSDSDFCADASGAAAGGNLTGGGIANRVVKWENTTHLTASRITDNGLIGINTTSPSEMLDVENGTIENLETGGILCKAYDDSWHNLDSVNSDDNSTFVGRQIKQWRETRINYTNLNPTGQVDNYTIRCVGYVSPSFSETYTFYVTTDDGARLWVNGKEIVNSWKPQGTTTYSGTIALVANGWYPIIIEHFERTGTQKLDLEWQSTSQARQIINASAMAYSAHEQAPTLFGTSYFFGSVGVGTVRPQPNLSVTVAGELGFMRDNISYGLINMPVMMASSDDQFIFMPTNGAGSADSELRLYIEDDSTDSFAIYGNSCGGGTCNSLSASSLVAKFEARGLIGINTSAPQALLHINASSTVNPFRITSSSSASRFIVDSSGNVGINTTGPNGTLHIRSRSSLGALRVEDNTGAILFLVNGSNKGVSSSTSTAGISSVAFGTTNTASGVTSVAMGSGNTASDTGSVAMGISNTASASPAVAMGNSNTASGQYSVAMGTFNTASGLYSVAMGASNTASASPAVAMGDSNTASEASSVAMGTLNTAGGRASVAMGNTTTANGTSSFAIGQFVRAMGNNSGVIGRGIQNTATGVLQNSISNSLMIGFNSTLPTFFVGTAAQPNANVTGLVGINTTSPSHTLTLVGTLNVTGGALNTLGLFVNATGAVSIGVSTPTNTLHVAGTANITGVTHHQDNVTLYNTNVAIRNVNPSANVSQESWLDTNGRVVALRYWNGTALVLNVTG